MVPALLRNLQNQPRLRAATKKQPDERCRSPFTAREFLRLCLPGGCLHDLYNKTKYIQKQALDN